MAPQWLTEEEQRAWRAYLRARTMLAVQLARQLQADSGLSMPEYEVLVHLSEAPGERLRPFQLGSDLGWEQSRMSHQLSRMARRGFVSREECPGDARGALVVLTEAGRDAIRSAAPGHAAAVRRLVFDPLDAAQAAAFGSVFEAMIDAADCGGAAEAGGAGAGAAEDSAAGGGTAEDSAAEDSAAEDSAAAATGSRPGDSAGR